MNNTSINVQTPVDINTLTATNEVVNFSSKKLNNSIYNLYNIGNTNSSINLQILDSNLNIVKNTFALPKTNANTSQLQPQITELANGNLAVSWVDYNNIGQMQGFSIQEISPSGDIINATQTTKFSDIGVTDLVPYLDVDVQPDGSYFASYIGFGMQRTVNIAKFSQDGTMQNNINIASDNYFSSNSGSQVKTSSDGSVLVSYPRESDTIIEKYDANLNPVQTYTLPINTSFLDITISSDDNGGFNIFALD